jgi:hypothetical protein
MPGERSSPGAIYNSNRFTLRCLIESLGAVHDDPRHRPDRSMRRAPPSAGGREERPHRHLRRRLGRRGRPPPPAVEREGRSTSGRSR